MQRTERQTHHAKEKQYIIPTLSWLSDILAASISLAWTCRDKLVRSVLASAIVVVRC